jgi:hypothetical protein
MGDVSKPVFLSVSTTAGYFLNWRGFEKTNQFGTQSISNASSTVSVTFTNAYGDTNYIVIANIVNTTDSTPSQFAYTITAKSTTGFTMTLSGDTDSAHYVLEWMTVHA